jgi:hypothetical protein
VWQTTQGTETGIQINNNAFSYLVDTTAPRVASSAEQVMIAGGGNIVILTRNDTSIPAEGDLLL